MFHVRRTDGAKVEMRMSVMCLDGFHDVIADWSESQRKPSLDEYNVSSAYFKAIQQGWQPPDQLKVDYSNDGRRRVVDTLGEVELGYHGPEPEPLRILTLKGTRARPLKTRKVSHAFSAKGKSRSRGSKSKPRPDGVKSKSSSDGVKSKSRPEGVKSKSRPDGMESRSSSDGASSK